MSNGFVTEMKFHLKARRKELQVELRQVEQALKAFDAEPAPTPAGKRPRRRVDLDQVLQTVKTSPGIAATDLAEKIGIPQGTAYSALNRLKDRDKVAKLGTGWFPTEQLGAGPPGSV